jgi:hypothetical protein
MLWNGQNARQATAETKGDPEDGRPLTLWEAIARNLLRIGDAVPGFIIPVYSSD